MGLIDVIRTIFMRSTSLPPHPSFRIDCHTCRSNPMEKFTQMVTFSVKPASKASARQSHTIHFSIKTETLLAVASFTRRYSVISIREPRSYTNVTSAASFSRPTVLILAFTLPAHRYEAHLGRQAWRRLHGNDGERAGGRKMRILDSVGGHLRRQWL